MALTRGFLVTEAHIDMLRLLPEKTCDKVLGAAFRAALGMPSTAEIKDGSGVLEALVGAISAAALRFDAENAEKRRKDAARKSIAKSASSRNPRESEGIRGNPKESEGENRNPNPRTGIRAEGNEGNEGNEGEYTQMRYGGDVNDGGLTAAAPPSVESIADWCEVHISPQPPAEWLADWRARMCEGGWRGSRGQNLLAHGLWRRELSAWWARARKNISAPAAEQDLPAPVNGAGRVAVPMYTGEIA